MLGTSAFSGRVVLATVSFFVYVVLVAAYAVLRLRKFQRDARKKGARVDVTAGQAA